MARMLLGDARLLLQLRGSGPLIALGRRGWQAPVAARSGEEVRRAARCLRLGHRSGPLSPKLQSGREARQVQIAAVEIVGIVSMETLMRGVRWTLRVRQQRHRSETSKASGVCA